MGTVRVEPHDFGHVTHLGAEALGPPGQRRFRLTALQDDRSAFLWLEKEQLASLGTALEQQLVRSSRVRRRATGPEDEEEPPMPLHATVDLRVGQLALGYDEDRALFILQAYGVDPEEQQQGAFVCTADHEQARRLVRRISRLMNTGRPVCPLCGAAIEGTHRCPRSNGHAEVVLR